MTSRRNFLIGLFSSVAGSTIPFSPKVPIEPSFLSEILFEPNDSFTRDRIKQLLNDCYRRKGIQDYIVVCDETNNTPELIDNHQFAVDVYIKPINSTTYQVRRTLATTTGVSFEDVIAHG